VSTDERDVLAARVRELETVLARIAELAAGSPEPDHFEGNIGANIAGERFPAREEER